MGQGVSSAIAPDAGYPAGCSGTYGNPFEITVAKVEGAAKRTVNMIAVSPLQRCSCTRALHLLFVLVSCRLPEEVREAQHTSRRGPPGNSHIPSIVQHRIKRSFAMPFVSMAAAWLPGGFQMDPTSTFAFPFLFVFVAMLRDLGGVDPAGNGKGPPTPQHQALWLTTSKQKRGDCATNGNLVVTLENGILKDAQARTGYVAANYQFQFDQPPQTGSIFTAGFSACSNGSLALGGSAVFYECASGDFFNLYDRSWAAQCSPVEILIMECGTASQGGDGQVVGTQIVTTTIVSALSDGQPQVKTMTTGIPVCQVSQIADGKLHRSSPISQSCQITC